MEAYKQYRSFQPPTPPPSHSHSLSQVLSRAHSHPHSRPPPQQTPSYQVQLPSNNAESTKLESIYTYVTFDPNDPKNPHNWSASYKAFVVGLLAFLTLSLTFASAVSSSAEDGMKAEFGCGQIAATAGTSMFLIGLGMGAMPMAPLSELYGRLPVYLITILLATIFEIASALSPNIASLLIFRLIAGFFSSAPLSNSGGTLNDIGDPVLRTLALPLFSTAGFAGPTLGPIIGGYLVINPSYGWRWCYWTCAIWHAFAFLLCFVLMPETLAPALLKYKAVNLRRITGEQSWRAPIEDESIHKLTGKYLQRPFKMLAVEPVVQFFIAYLTIVYIVLYGFFDAYPIIFSEHGLPIEKIGLTFIPVMVGFFVLMAGNVLHYRRYKKLAKGARAGVERRGIRDGKVEPEERLVPLMVCAICFPAGVFWFAWTSAPHFSIWAPMMSGLLFGIGLLAIFQGSVQYMIDAYGQYASSALAGSTLVRYSVAGLVILAFPKMYETLGDQWATSLFAFLGLALTPVPFVFYRYGHRVRAQCQFTVRD